MTHTATVVPAAPTECALSPAAYAERVAWIADLNHTLVRHAQRDLTLELHYPAAEVPRVCELVRREQACCDFLDFEVAESSTGVVLRISAPAATRNATEDIFAPFLSGVGAAARPAGTGKSRPTSAVEVSACGSSDSATCSTDPSAPCGCSSSTAAWSHAATPRAASADMNASGEVARSGLGRASRAGAITAAGIVFACGVCCLLPFALPAVALTAFGFVVVVASAYRWPVFVAVGAVISGWAWVLSKRVRSHRAPAGETAGRVTRDVLRHRGKWTGTFPGW